MAARQLFNAQGPSGIPETTLQKEEDHTATTKPTVPMEQHFDSLKSLFEVNRANIHGVISQVSPMKSSKAGKTYFDAILMDDDAQVRILGFGDKAHDRLKHLEEIADPIAVQGCRVKRSRYSDCIEVLINQQSSFSVSQENKGHQAIDRRY